MRQRNSIIYLNESGAVWNTKEPLENKFKKVKCGNQALVKTRTFTKVFSNIDDSFKKGSKPIKFDFQER